MWHVPQGGRPKGKHRAYALDPETVRTCNERLRTLPTKPMRPTPRKGDNSMSNDYTRHPVSAQWDDQTEEQYDALKARIALVGFTDPIIALPDGQIVDGWHRFLACNDLGVDPVFEVRDLNALEIAECSITAHRGRRNLTASELVDSSIRALQAAGLEFAERGDNQFRNGEGEVVATITRKRLHELTGASEGTIKRALARHKPADPDPDPPADTVPATDGPEDPDPDPFAPDPDDGTGADAGNGEETGQAARQPAAGTDPGTGTTGDDGTARQGEAGTDGGDPPDRPPSKFDILKAEYRQHQDETNATVTRLESELDKVRADLAARDERIAILETESDPGTRGAIDQANNRENLVASLKSQLNAKTQEVTDLKRERTVLRRKLTVSEKLVAKLNDELTALSGGAGGDDAGDAS